MLSVAVLAPIFLRPCPSSPLSPTCPSKTCHLCPPLTLPPLIPVGHNPASSTRLPSRNPCFPPLLCSCTATLRLGLMGGRRRSSGTPAASEWILRGSQCHSPASSPHFGTSSCFNKCVALQQIHTFCLHAHCPPTYTCCLAFVPRTQSPKYCFDG